MTNPTIVAIERTYDGIPRAGGAQAEPVGPFELFRPTAKGAWPLYARPRLGVTDFAPADVAAVQARQRELGLPEAIEWVDNVTPALLPAVRATGASVVLAPLMVLDVMRLPDPTTLAAAELVALDPDSPEFLGLYAASGAVAALGFAAAGTTVGPAGPAERDAAIGPINPDRAARLAEGCRSGRTGEAIARTRNEGVLARGAFQGFDGGAEIVGVATLPAARRRGLGAAVSAFVARLALDRGYGLVFLGAADTTVARVYARIGFTHIGTACIAE